MNTPDGAAGDELTTFAPAIGEPPNLIPTGNLTVALPEIDRADGRVDSLGVLHDRAAGVVTAHGGTNGLAAPIVVIDGKAQPVRPEWARVADWIPHFVADLPTGSLEAWYLAPVDDRGVTLRLRYRHTASEVADVEIGWHGSWASTTVEHLRSKPVTGTRTVFDDDWTGSRVVTESTGLPLLALAWRAGTGMTTSDDGSGTGWRATTTARSLTAGDDLVADVMIGVACEPDGAATTALHLRRRGFDALLADTTSWLDGHRLPMNRPGLDHPVDAVLDTKLHTNILFSWFYAQGDCLDTGRPVIVTSRSPHYYVCGAFWSRDAYLWTFPALLLVDPPRARRVLVETIRSGGARLADHALYLNGTSLYPGFELDQAAAPVLAVAEYVHATDDASVLAEPGMVATLTALLQRVGAWRHPSWDLYGTFLLPTDDPTDHPYVTTDNALLAAAFDACADLLDTADTHGITVDAPWSPDELRTRAERVRMAIAEHLVVDGPHGAMWAWACDADGNLELRDEPPLGLLTLPHRGVGGWDDPRHVATRTWLTDDNPHHYRGRYGGAGSAHFPYASGFDLANRMLDPGTADPDPLDQFTDTPMDHDLACESWDPDTGTVTTGAAMASMAGLLAWTTWQRLRRAGGEPPSDEQP